MERIEFRVSPDGKVYFNRQGDREHRLSRFETAVVSGLREMIMSRFPAAWDRLQRLYPPSRNTKAACDCANYKCVERFVRCNFGEHDLLTPDIEHEVMHFEEVRCPLRGICPEEGVVCKPHDMLALTDAERMAARLYLFGYTFDEIATLLGKSPQTVKSQLQSIKSKTGARNCREIIKVVRMRRLDL